MAFLKFWQYFSVLQNFEPTLAIFYSIWHNLIVASGQIFQKIRLMQKSSILVPKGFGRLTSNLPFE